MKKNSNGLIARILMFAMVSLLLLPAAALAQNRNRDGRWDRRDDRYENDRDWRNRNRRGRTYDGYDNYGGGFDLRQTALNAGYNDGMQEGRKDRSRNERFEFRDEGRYQSADRDYNSRYGNRELYRNYYRQAFQNGYRDGYGAYGSYGYNY
jgi:hypothetical protein